MYNPSMDTIQSTLDKLAAESDPRTSVFEVEIVRLQNSSLTLSGRLLDESQLTGLLSHFPNWTLDASSIRILHKRQLRHMHVATNLTGLYEKPTFGMPLSSELSYGTEVEILDEEGKWVFTRQEDGYLGWAYKAYLGEGKAQSATHLVLAPSYELRAQPDAESEIMTRLVSGMGVCVEDVRGDWARVSANKEGWMPSSLLRGLSNLPQSLEEKRKTLIQDSKRMIGVPYLWGGNSGNGIDCSGFTRLLHRWIGVRIPRDADMQYEAAKPVKPPFEVGELLFFRAAGSERRITHVGMSLGGWDMVHSSRGHNGAYIDNVEEKESLKAMFAGAGSFLG